MPGERWPNILEGLLEETTELTVANQVEFVCPACGQKAVASPKPLRIQASPASMIAGARLIWLNLLTCPYCMETTPQIIEPKAQVSIQNQFTKVKKF